MIHQYLGAYTNLYCLFYLQMVVEQPPYEQPPYPYGLQPDDVRYVLADLGNALHELSGAWLTGMKDWARTANSMVNDLKIVSGAMEPPEWATLLVLSLMSFVIGALVVGLGCLQLKGCGLKTRQDPEKGKPPPAYVYVRDHGDLFSDLHVRNCCLHKVVGKMMI